jgi:hypothetical protein
LRSAWLVEAHIRADRQPNSAIVDLIFIYVSVSFEGRPG